MKFEHVSIYNGIGFKKKLKAPTEHCFVLKVCLRFYCVAWLSLALSLKEIQYRFADYFSVCLGNFIRVTKVIWDSTSFALFRSIIGPKKSRLPLNQPIRYKRSPALWSRLLVFTLSSDWPPGISWPLCSVGPKCLLRFWFYDTVEERSTK